MFKKVYSLYSAFYPSLHFTLSLQSAFYTQSAFYPWSAVCSLQSAVRSLQSAVCSLHFTLTDFCFCSFITILKKLSIWTRSMTGGPCTRSKVGVHGPLVHVLSSPRFHYTVSLFAKFRVRLASKEKITDSHFWIFLGI